jgi:hypothetical protein
MMVVKTPLRLCEFLRQDFGEVDPESEHSVQNKQSIPRFEELM